MTEAIVGIIGGTGLYEIEGLIDSEPLDLETPFGKPSSIITRSHLGEVTLLFLTRHGKGHVLLPSEVNYRANIFALKKLHAQWCLSVSAVGSLQEKFEPGHIVLPDQFLDLTKNRINTFFGNGICAHLPFASPICPVLQQQLFAGATPISSGRHSKVHRGGTYVCIEGPAFSSRAESHLYRSWGASIIGMTNATEAKLAREAEIAYATLALVTDFDCWRNEQADIDVAELLKTLAANTELAKDIIKQVVPTLKEMKPSALAANALANAIISDPMTIPEKLKRDLQPIIGRYMD